MFLTYRPKVVSINAVTAHILSVMPSANSFQLPTNKTSVSLSEIISALSVALDLTEGAVSGHALRTCLLGMRLADEAQLSLDARRSLYYALLLKDVGCSSNALGIRTTRS